MSEESPAAREQRDPRDAAFSVEGGRTRDLRRNIELNVGKACNNRCVFCLDGLPKAEDRSYMPLPDMKAEITRWFESGHRSLGFLGGEPTTCPWLPEAIAHARDLGFTRIAIATNATKLRKDYYVDRLLEAGLTRVTISMHGHTPTLEDKLTRVPGNFFKKVKAIKHLVSKRDEGLLPDNVSVNIVVNGWNYKHLPRMLQFFYGLGLDDVRANFIRAEGYAEEVPELTPRYTLVVPVLMKCVLLNEHHFKQSFTFGGVPLCVLPVEFLANRRLSRKYLGEYWDLDTDCSIRASGEGAGYGIAKVDGGRARFNWQDRKRFDLKHHMDKCGRCRYAEVCEGVWKNYLDFYGEDEFSPLPLIALLGCREPAQPATPSNTDDSAETAGPSPGVLVLAGGGTEGDLTDMRAWSARLYRHLLDGGDVTGDGLVQVLVLSTAEESDWIPTYLVQLGADAAENLRVASRAAADDAALTERFAACDAVFLKGGDQGRYYDLWNDTLLEELILEVHGRGGGVGGTSAGAMSLSGYALAGGMDYVSADVLVDSHTPYLDDASDGGPGVHDDFLGLWPGALVDTHFTERGRLGRLAGAMALALDEGAPLSLLGVGIEQSTGVVVRGGEAEVIGDGTVTLLRPSEPAVRTPGQGLLWRGVALDRLPQGWTFDAATGDLGETPAGAIAVSPTRLTAALAEPWQADGGDRTHEQRFGWAASAAPFSVDPGSDPPLLTGAIGQLNAHDRDRRALAHELLYAALGEHPGAAGLLVGAGARLEVEGATLRSTLDPDAEGPQPSTLILDTAGVRAVHRGATPSPYAPSSSGLFPVGLIGAQLHVIGHSESSGWTWDLASGQAEAM